MTQRNELGLNARYLKSVIRKELKCRGRIDTCISSTSDHFDSS